MKLAIHRGYKTIGGTCIEISDGETRIILDAGSPLDVSLYDEEALKKNRPDVQGLFHRDNNALPISAVFLSHFHPDHSTYCYDVCPEIPVYMSPLTMQMMIALKIFADKAIPKNFHPIKKLMPVGKFSVEAYPVDHSVVGAVSFVIRHNEKIIVYTGDFRTHGTSAYLTQKFLEKCPKRPDILIMEGTMVGQDRAANMPRTEVAVQHNIKELINNQKYWPILACFSPTNLDRLNSFLNACRDTGTELVIDLFSAYLYWKMQKNEVLFREPIHKSRTIRVFCPKGQLMNVKKNYKIDFVRMIEKYGLMLEMDKLAIPEKRVILFRPNHLGAWWKCKVQFENTDIIISQYEGTYKGQEDTMMPYKKYLNDNNIKLVYIHTGGHAFVEDLKKLSQTIKPKKLVPIHTDAPHHYEKYFNNVITVDNHGIQI